MTYRITVFIKTGWAVPAVPISPALVGDMNGTDKWDDILPGALTSYLAGDILGTNTGFDSNYCGAGCDRAAFDGIDSLGMLIEVWITYEYQFVCSGANCTLSVNVLHVDMFNRNGSPYIGPSLSALTPPEDTLDGI